MKHATLMKCALVLSGLPLCAGAAAGTVWAWPAAQAAAVPGLSGLPALTADDDQAAADYPVNFAPGETSGNVNRYLTSLTLTGSADGAQTIAVPHDAPMLLYRPLLGQVFTARAGERLTPVFGFSGTWMNGYVYLDRGSDGQFSYALNDDYTIPAGSDLMTYAYVMAEDGSGGYASDGTPLTGNATNVLNPPPFTVPADLEPGYYRMRFKVDWGSVDPGGNTDPTQLIKNNGGEIVDVRLNVHGDNCAVTVRSEGGGTVTAADGTPVDGRSFPFGQPLELLVTPAEGYALDGLVVRHGYGLDGDSLVHGTPQYVDETLPAYLVQDGRLQLPAGCMDGEVRVEAFFVPAAGQTPAGEDYPLAFDRDAESGLPVPDDASFRLRVNATQGGMTAVNVPTDSPAAYVDLRPKQISVVPGDRLDFTLSQSLAPELHAYFYVDLNQDGQFAATLDASGRPTLSGELVSYNYYQGRNSLGEAVEAGAAAADALPAWTVPENLPRGVYRARLKLDADAADAAGSPQLLAAGGRVVDLLLNVHGLTQPLTVETTNGSVNGPGNIGLPLEVSCFRSLSVVPTPVAEGYEAAAMTVRHGHNLDGPQYVHGNRQWSSFTRTASSVTIPKDSIDGDVHITVDFEPTAEAEYRLVFSDEFNAPDGTQPASEWWSRSPRQSSTWNRWLSDSEEVIYQEGGQLVARAIPNPDQEADPVPMITGGVQSSGKFSFKYGKIEARVLTNPYTGNFPAFWLMPQDQSAGWPSCGEIDIWEQIDSQNTAYHTVHSHWTYDLHNTGNPRSSFNETVQMDRYHTYGFEWTEQELRWYVDGRQVASYAKSADSNALAQGQWPFDKAFYIILNQSVGNGSWAANADVNHTYETRFDWVRVYQLDSQIDAVRPAAGADRLKVSAARGAIEVSSPRAVMVRVYDLAGRCLFADQVEGAERIAVPQGIYVVNGQKVAVP